MEFMTLKNDLIKDNVVNLSKENSNIKKELQLLKLDSIFMDCKPSFEYNKVKIFQLELDFNIDPKVFVDNFLSRYNR